MLNKYASYILEPVVVKPCSTMIELIKMKTYIKIAFLQCLARKGASLLFVCGCCATADMCLLHRFLVCLKLPPHPPPTETGPVSGPAAVVAVANFLQNIWQKYRLE